MPPGTRFSCWSVLAEAWWFKLTALFTVSYTVIVLIGPWRDAFERDLYIYGGQLVAISAMLFALPRTNLKAEEHISKSELLVGLADRLKTAIRVEHDLSQLMLATWVLWAVYYAVKFLFTLLHVDNPIWSSVIPNALSNGTNATILLAYLELTKKTYDLTTASRLKGVPLLPAFGMVLVLTMVDLALTLKDKGYAKQTGALVGFVSAIVIALFLARLESQLVRAPGILMVFNYCYVGLQPAAPLLIDPMQFEHCPKLVEPWVVFVMALWMKQALFALLFWLFESGVLLYYLVEARVIGERTEFGRASYLAEFREHHIK